MEQPSNYNVRIQDASDLDKALVIDIMREAVEDAAAEHEQQPAAVWKVRPPHDEQFGDSAFLPDPRLTELMHDLIEQHRELRFLQEFELAVLWKRAGGKSGGLAVMGRCQRPSGLLAMYSQVDWIIWLAADHVRDLLMPDRNIEALLYHELMHCDVDDENRPGIRGHDVTAFRSEVERYGLWRHDLRALDQTMRQLRLPEASNG